MTCRCKELLPAPDEGCWICIQKHFLDAWGAMREFRHKETDDNRDFAISEMGLAISHAAEIMPSLADRIRAIRHEVQYRRPVQREKWSEVRKIINAELLRELNQSAQEISSKVLLPPPAELPEEWKIYVFSNVDYPEKNRLFIPQKDLIVFLNKAKNIEYYKDHFRKMIYHRSPKDCYGTPIPGCINRYVFDDPEKIPSDFIHELKKSYDWNYDKEDEEEIKKRGGVKCMTTGYMAVKWLEHLYPRHQIILVNFGFSVKKSTYRCPFHNWQYEAMQLRAFPHIYLEEEDPAKEAKK